MLLLLGGHPLCVPRNLSLRSTGVSAFKSHSHPINLLSIVTTSKFMRNRKWWYQDKGMMKSRIEREVFSSMEKVNVWILLFYIKWIDFRMRVLWVFLDIRDFPVYMINKARRGHLNKGRTGTWVSWFLVQGSFSYLLSLLNKWKN